MDIRTTPIQKAMATVMVVFAFWALGGMLSEILPGRLALSPVVIFGLLALVFIGVAMIPNYIYRLRVDDTGFEYTFLPFQRVSVTWDQVQSTKEEKMYVNGTWLPIITVVLKQGERRIQLRPPGMPNSEQISALHEVHNRVSGQ